MKDKLKHLLVSFGWVVFIVGLFLRSEKMKRHRFFGDRSAEPVVTDLLITLRLPPRLELDRTEWTVLLVTQPVPGVSQVSPGVSQVCARCEPEVTVISE